LRPYDEKSVKIERLAVLPKMRRKGIALKLMEKGLEYCKNTSWEKILLHAQLTAVPLYEKLGFEKVGGIFEEAGIQHVKMIYHL
jgi:predicted GNAT family N-acyltransferase